MGMNWTETFGLHWSEVHSGSLSWAAVLPWSNVQGVFLDIVPTF